MTAGAILDEVAERFLGKVPFRETKYLGREQLVAMPCAGLGSSQCWAAEREVNQFQIEIDANNIQAWEHLRLSPPVLDLKFSMSCCSCPFVLLCCVGFTW